MNQDRADAPKREAAAGNVKRSGGFQRGPQKDHKRRWLFLLVDILLLAAIVGAVIFIVFLLAPEPLFDTSNGEERTITYQIELPGVEVERFSLQVGDIVTDVSTGQVIGEVVRFDGRDYEVYTDKAGAVDEVYGSHMVDKIVYPDDEYQTITVTVSAKAEYLAGVGYSVNDCRIAVGRAYEVRFSSYTDEGVCVAISAE